MRIETIGDATLYLGDAMASLRAMPPASVQTCVTSPPYWGLRDYGVEGQIGLEPTPEEYVAKIVAVFREVWRVLRDDGTLWVNLGSSYASAACVPLAKASVSPGALQSVDNSCLNYALFSQYVKPKDLVPIPWMVAMALQKDGWYLRSDIIWAKPNPMPESVTDRPTKAHEYLFLLTKSERYFYDTKAIAEPSIDPESLRPEGRNPRGDDKFCQATLDERRNGAARTREGFSKLAGGCYLTRNRRSVWTIATTPYKGAHFAIYPRALVEPCILAGSREGDMVLDPFGGSGTTAAVALSLGRRAIICELKPDYAELIRERIKSEESFVQPRLFPSPPQSDPVRRPLPPKRGFLF